MVQYMGYILTGHECALFMPDDGWENLKELFDEIKGSRRVLRFHLRR